MDIFASARTLMKHKGASLTNAETPVRHLTLPADRSESGDELAVDVASVEVCGSDRHERCRDQRHRYDRGKGDAENQAGKDVKPQARHREVIAKLLEARGVSGRPATRRRWRKKPDRARAGEHKGNRPSNAAFGAARRCSRAKELRKGLG